jgi:hypothetical protein
MKLTLPIVITAVFLSGLWAGSVFTYGKIGIFGYDPCWMTLADVRREARYQEELGDAGWNLDNPNIQNCVMVDPAWHHMGWREMTPSERRVAGQ